MIPEWLSSTAALIAAFGTLFAGIAALWAQVRFKESKTGATERKFGRRWVLIAGIVFVLFSGSVFAIRLIKEESLPANAKLTLHAWDAFNRGDFNKAIATADECIVQFQGDADNEQKQLEKDYPTVPTGEVSKEEKEKILRRGPLNDVATCFLIKGQAAEKLGQIEEAKQAYQAASVYTYARCFDPSWNGFWSPSDKAKSRLEHLK